MPCCGCFSGLGRRPANVDGRRRTETQMLGNETTQLERRNERADMPQCFKADGSHNRDGKGNRRKIRMLAYGDSLTAGYHSQGRRFAPYGKRLATQLDGHFDAEVWVCGLSGLTACDLADKQQSSEIIDCVGRNGMGLKHLLENVPRFDLVLLMAGTNDLATFEGRPEFIVENIKRLHKICHHMGIPTIALSVPDNSFTSKATGSRFEEDYHMEWKRINDELKTWASSSSSDGNSVHRMFVNVADIVPWSPRAHDGGLFDDALHFSPAGYEKLGIHLADVVCSNIDQISPSHTLC